MELTKQMLITILTLLFVSTFVYAEDKDPVENKEVEAHIVTVKKIEKAGNYIYLQIDEEGKEDWLATMPSFFKEELFVGDKVEYTGGDRMSEFKSTVLNKTFDSVLFLTRIRALKEIVSEAVQSAPAKEPQKTTPVIKKIVIAPVKGEIEKAEDSWNIEEIFLKRDQLKNKEVVLRGKAMKAIENILANTWVTLQDGTGLAPDNQIVVVTKDTVNVGDILTVKGTLKTDVDLGAGYKYKALIDDAIFMK